MSGIQSPGALFIRLWHIAVDWAPNIRSLVGHLPTSLKSQVEDALCKEEPGDVVKDLVGIIGSVPNDDLPQVARTILGIMREIDRCFYQVHPRALISMHHGGVTLPIWLVQAAEARNWRASYADLDDSRLVARGPLLRTQREEHASAADCLADKFSALAVVPTQLKADGRSIKVSHTLIASDLVSGVAPGKNLGSEQIAFLSVAEAADDLSIIEKSASGTSFLDYRAHENLDVVKKVLDGLTAAGDVDIALAPELVIDEVAADSIGYKLLYSSNDVRLLVSGSGHTSTSDLLGMHWNESRAVNGIGTELWRQRKLVPASIDGGYANDLGISVEVSKRYFEFNAAGNEVCIVDIEGFGRCVTLICQDLEAGSLAPELITHFQPDWIFVPILDRDVGTGRWAHRRAFSLSSIAPTRFVMSTSTSLCRRLGALAPGESGLAVGPLAPSAEDEGRLHASLKPESGVEPEVAIVRWRSRCAKWKLSIVGAG